MCLYSHLWSIHSFGFVQDIVLPLLGVKKLKEGEKSKFMDFVRYMYACGSVYHFYWYLDGDEQPGFGWNHQTLAVITMLGGRLLAGSNFKNVEWIRRVEMPGYVFVLVRYCLCNGDSLVAGVVTTVLYGIVIICLVMKPIQPKPGEMILDRDVRTFLNEKWETRQNLFPAPKPPKVEAVQKWWKTQAADWAEKYPLHNAVVSGDEDRVRALLAQLQDDTCVRNDCNEQQPSGFGIGLRQRKKGTNTSADACDVRPGDEHPSVDRKANASPNTPMKDWYDCTPLHFACHLGFAGITIQLLMHGGNPWLPIVMGLDGTSLAKNAGHKELFAFFNELVPIVFKAFNVDEKTLEEMKNPSLRKRLAEIL